MSWYDCTEYIAIAHEKKQEQLRSEEEQWAQTRELWVALMNAHFKKKGGGEYTSTDLIKLSFDPKDIKSGPPTLEEFERLASKHGKRKRRKKDGNK